MRMKPILRLLPLPAMALLLAGCMGDNKSLSSVNQPLVADGTAAVPNCPNWRSAELPEGSATSSNYGCATNANLAAMVANPEDLIHGHPYDGAGTDVAVRSVKEWRETEPTGKNGIEKVSSKAQTQ